MTDATLVPTDRSPDLATFKVLVGGEVLPEAYQVQTVVIDRELNRIPTATVVLFDGDAAKGEFEISGGDLLIPGAEVEIRIGYHGEELPLFLGVITRHGIKTRQNQPSILRIECKDAAVKMTVGRKTAFFYESTDSDIAAELAEAHGLDTDIEDTSVTHAEMVQYRVSDWDFMVTRLEANGKLVLPHDGTLNAFSPDLAAEPVLALKFGDTMLDFEAEIDARDQLTAVKTTAWDPAGQAIVESEAEDPAEVGGDLAGSDLAAVAAPESEEWRHGGALADEELQAWADARLMRSRLSKVRGRVKCQGFDVLPGSLITLEGVGPRFNGPVFVSATRQEVSKSNWTSYLSFGFDAKWYRERHSVEESAPNLVPGIRGLQVGITRQLEEDPDGEFRVLVALPVLDAEEDGVWARIATLDAGAERGSFFRPEIDDEVVVGFLNGDPRQAVILGMLHSSAKAAPFEPANDNHERGFVSRGGMKFVFNDENNVLTISTPNENIVELSEEDGQVVVKDENGSSITLNSDGITLDSAADIILTASGDIKLEGTNVEIAADAEFKADGGAGAEVTTSAVAKLKGSLVQIN